MFCLENHKARSSLYVDVEVFMKRKITDSAEFMLKFISRCNQVTVIIVFFKAGQFIKRQEQVAML